MRRRFKEHSAKLFVIQDTPQSIALGAAIGIFLGFTPLFGLKTLLAFALAALFRVNKIAAVLAVSLHDVVFPLWPVLYRVEFDLGYWVLHAPHQWPARLEIRGLDFHQWLNWKLFSTVGGPTLLGSVIFGAPASAAAYALLKRALARRQHPIAQTSSLVPPASIGKRVNNVGKSISQIPLGEN